MNMIWKDSPEVKIWTLWKNETSSIDIFIQELIQKAPGNEKELKKFFPLGKEFGSFSLTRRRERKGKFQCWFIHTGVDNWELYLEFPVENLSTYTAKVEGIEEVFEKTYTPPHKNTVYNNYEPYGGLHRGKDEGYF